MESSFGKSQQAQAESGKGKALLKMIELREERAHLTPLPQFATLLMEEYYEIVKELIAGIMSIDGWKTTSHELLVGYLAEVCPEFSRAEIVLIDQLRGMRNDIAYRGIMVDVEYLDRNKDGIQKVILHLKETLHRRIGRN